MKPEGPIKLSSVVVAKNEERNIARCLQSLQGVIDDIVVLVDSSSSDRTLEIVRSFNVNWEEVKWEGFSATKNKALGKTKFDWVFWIDADEELTPELRSELLEFKESTPLYNSYEVARRAFFLDKWIKHGGWYPSRAKRLFNKNFARFNNKSVHEGLEIPGKSGLLKNDLNHYTDPSIEHYFNKFNSYTTLAAKEIVSRGGSASMLDLLLRPLYLFVKMYILKLGFLDGLHGFILALFSSVYVFTKYTKVWELKREDK